ncbi:hypothetical protein ACFZB9_19255 [Kitasatospora sp. NPDC008050]|uniref:hypothetical protein n=1 Tax=Kitasatospora sp. NPDC008050 TaxID=3364021 RepID=UPI0036E773CB
MTSPTLVDEVGATQEWAFGSYPYGLESLVLPEPGAMIRDRSRHAPTYRTGLWQELALLDPLPQPTTAEELYWFRWITGHQAVFALWQLIDDELDLVLDNGSPSAATRAARMMDAYSVLLVYTGSSSRELYEQLIRPAMMLQHRSFSGRWARDYATIPPRLRTLRARYRKQPDAPTAIVELNRAGRLNHQVHMAIAAKLVPNGDSLLRSGDGLAALGSPTEEAARLYDAFFVTQRAERTLPEVVDQLLHRLRVILLDLHSNGLYPPRSSGPAESPTDLGSADLGSTELACFTDRAVPLLIDACTTAESLGQC